MEESAAERIHGKKENGSFIAGKPDHSEAVVKDVLDHSTSSAKGIMQGYTVRPRNGLDATQEVHQGDHSLGEVNMEAAITSDDVIKAGGFGTRDDLNSFLPVASDLTDFEASLIDAREYEEPQEVPRKPGLGWTGATTPE
ncbi:hypothetical protein Dimus_029730 [Dionaea muscipula]